MTGRIFDIKRYAIHDGPGIRTTVFLKGCPLKCRWCHNPESRSASPQPMRKARPTVEEACDMVGYEISVENVLREVEKDQIFYDESGGGVTFSGGEPLFQPAFLVALLRGARRRGIHTVVDTTGFASRETLDAIAGDVGLFLYDLKLIDEQRHRHYTGVSNGRILENLRALDQAGRPLWIRVPVVPGVNDDLENMTATARLVASLGTRPPVYLLPFHAAGAGKYERLGMTNPLPEATAPDREQLDAVARSFTEHGVHVHLSGATQETELCNSRD